MYEKINPLTEAQIQKAYKNYFNEVVPANTWEEKARRAGWNPPRPEWEREALKHGWTPPNPISLPYNWEPPYRITC